MQPRIIPRSEHGISRKQISPNALKTLYRLHDNGFIAYLVGGCVRDLLLGRQPKDFDIATDASPSQIKRLFGNCRLIGRRFRLAHLHFGEEILEVSTFRAISPPEAQDQEGPPRHLKDENGMVLRDNVFGTPEEDALRRDFTINALAYNIADFSVIDYTDGIRDLRERIIRPIGDAEVRFTEDPVRMIRAARFAASHDFRIDPATWETMCRMSPAIVRASPARLYEEMLKLFLMGAARPVLGLLEESGLLKALFPELADWLAKGDGRRIVGENLSALDRLHGEGFSPSPPLWLAALFGPLLEEKALCLQQGGTPPQQAIDAVVTHFLKEGIKTITIPGRIGVQLRRILALQPALRRLPPRKSASLAARPGFEEALTYLVMAARTEPKLQPATAWWKNYLTAPPGAEPQAQKAPSRRRRRRRRKGRPPAASEEAPNTPPS